MTKEDFAAFKSSFAAHEHAYENTTDREMYAIRSTTIIEKEMNRLLEAEKEQGKGKPEEKEQEAKSSHDQERPR